MQQGLRVRQRAARTTAAAMAALVVAALAMAGRTPAAGVQHPCPRDIAANVIAQAVHDLHGAQLPAWLPSTQRQGPRGWDPASLESHMLRLGD